MRLNVNGSFDVNKIKSTPIPKLAIVKQSKIYQKICHKNKHPKIAPKNKASKPISVLRSSAGLASGRRA